MRYAGGHRHPEKGNRQYQNQNRPVVMRTPWNCSPQIYITKYFTVGTTTGPE